jgi:hypothetical protein
VIQQRHVDFVDRLGDDVYRVAVTLFVLLVLDSAVAGMWNQAIAYAAVIGSLVCVIRIRDAVYVMIDRWRDRKIAEIHAKYREGEEHDGR